MQSQISYLTPESHRSVEAMKTLYSQGQTITSTHGKPSRSGSSAWLYCLSLPLFCFFSANINHPAKHCIARPAQKTRRNLSQATINTNPRHQKTNYKARKTRRKQSEATTMTTNTTFHTALRASSSSSEPSLSNTASTTAATTPTSNTRSRQVQSIKAQFKLKLAAERFYMHGSGTFEVPEDSRPNNKENQDLDEIAPKSPSDHSTSITTASTTNTALLLLRSLLLQENSAINPINARIKRLKIKNQLTDVERPSRPSGEIRKVGSWSCCCGFQVYRLMMIGSLRHARHRNSVIRERV